MKVKRKSKQVAAVRLAGLVSDEQKRGATLPLFFVSLYDKIVSVYFLFSTAMIARRIAIPVAAHACQVEIRDASKLFDILLEIFPRVVFVAFVMRNDQVFAPAHPASDVA